jgi:hypothetical protein
MTVKADTSHGAAELWPIQSRSDAAGGQKQIAHGGVLLRRRNLLNALPPLTTFEFCDLRAQPQQIIDPEPRASAGCLREQILLGETGPGSEDRAQFAFAVEVHHPIFAPVIFAGRENELRSAPGMKGVRNLEGDGRLMVRTSCSS